MRRIIILNVMVIMLGSFAHGQEQLSKKQHADLLFSRYEYFHAASLYAELAGKKNPDVKLLERLATCYRKMNDYEAAEKWYALAVTDIKAESLTHFYYAEVLLTNERFEQAKLQYKRYAGMIKGLNDLSQMSAQMLDVKVASCDSAAVWLKNTGSFSVNNATGLNTKYADWGLSYFGKTGLVFTSERPTDDAQKYNDIYKWTGNPWLKIVQATAAESVTNELQVIRKAYSSFGADYHVGPMIVNPTADTAYVTIATRTYARNLPIDKKENKNSERRYTRRLELIIAVKSEGRWTYHTAFPYNDVKTYSLGNAALSKNGTVLYFTSDMPGSIGKTDIWYSEKQSDGSWGKPVNCGLEINTLEEESFPTIGAAGELYYSSKGKIGMGGYDVYTSKGEKAIWKPSVNLKYPVNTTYDDFYFSTVDGLSGYLSSNRKGGAGDDDIYSFVYKESGVVKPKPETPKPETPK
jgi:tetratricopeptide (TPR) repeat protein